MIFIYDVISQEHLINRFIKYFISGLQSNSLPILVDRLSNHTPYGHTQTIWSGNMVYTIYGYMVSYGHTAIQK